MRARSRGSRLKLGKSSAGLDASLRCVVGQAHVRVPFYGRVWDAAGVSVIGFRGAEDLPKLPVVRKHELLAGGLEDRLSGSVRRERLVVRSTSGTSGAPIAVYMTRPEFRFRQLTLFRAMWRTARRPLPVTIVEAGAWIPPDGRGEALVRRMPLAKVVYISRRQPLGEQVDALRGLRPSILTGCPASLEMIAAEMRRLAVQPPHPRAVITRGEVLHGEVRRRLAEVFGCRIVDFYNAQEVGNIAWECADHEGTYHVNGDTCVVEVVDAAGNLLPAGGEGRVVVTCLYNMTMPIIRYAMGDRGTLAPLDGRACTCGHRGQTLVSLAGRDDDFVVLPDGRAISPRLIDDLFIDACRSLGIEDPFTRAIRDYQVVQDSPSHLLVRVAAAAVPPERLRGLLVDNLAALHPELRCDVDWVREIESGEGGKRKRIVSSLRP